MNTPTPFQPQTAREGEYQLTFSQFKALVNSINEAVWGNAYVYVGEDAICPVVDLSQHHGLPAAPKGSSAARFYGVSPGVPKKIAIQFMTPDQLLIREKKAI